LLLLKYYYPEVRAA